MLATDVQDRCTNAIPKTDWLETVEGIIEDLNPEPSLLQIVEIGQDPAAESKPKPKLVLASPTRAKLKAIASNLTDGTHKALLHNLDFKRPSVSSLHQLLTLHADLAL